VRLLDKLFYNIEGRWQEYISEFGNRCKACDEWTFRTKLKYCKPCFREKWDTVTQELDELFGDVGSMEAGLGNKD